MIRGHLQKCQVIIVYPKKQMNHYPPACIVKLNLDDYHATFIDVLNLLVDHGSGYFSQTLGSAKSAISSQKHLFKKSVMVGG